MEAYQKKFILEADSALAQKLDAEIEIQRLLASAFAKRNVPMNVFGSGSAGAGVPVGSDAKQRPLCSYYIKYSKTLGYDREVKK